MYNCINCYYFILAAVKRRCTESFTPVLKHLWNSTHQSHLNEKDYLKSTIRFSLCYCIFDKCCNPLYSRKSRNRFIPAVSKSIRNHLHSELCSKRSGILVTRSTLAASSNWHPLYFLLSFTFVASCGGYGFSVFADLLLFNFTLLLLFLLLLLSLFLCLFHLFVILFFLLL